MIVECLKCEKKMKNVSCIKSSVYRFRCDTCGNDVLINGVKDESRQSEYNSNNRG